MTAPQPRKVEGAVDSSLEADRGIAMPEAAAGRVDHQPVWDGTEILRVVGEAVVDFAAACEHRILVLDGVGRLHLTDGIIRLSRGLTVVCARPVISAVEAASAQPLVLLHQVVQPSAHPRPEALAAGDPALLAWRADSPAAGSTPSGRTSRIYTGSAAHSSAIPLHHPPGGPGTQDDPVRWALPPVIGNGVVHASLGGGPGLGVRSDFAGLPPPALTGG